MCQGEGEEEREEGAGEEAGAPRAVERSRGCLAGLDDAAIRATLDGLAAEARGRIGVEPLRGQRPRRAAAGREAPPDLSCRRATRVLASAWRTSSF